MLIRQVVAYTVSDGRCTLLICEAQPLQLVLVAPATVCMFHTQH